MTDDDHYVPHPPTLHVRVEMESREAAQRHDPNRWSGLGRMIQPGHLRHDAARRDPFAALDPQTDSTLHPQAPAARYAPPRVPAHNQPHDPSIESLQLSGIARDGAYALKRQFPSIRFTSGRRSLAAQADAMAGNIVHRRHYIAHTYDKHSRGHRVHVALQKWVDQHPEAKTRAEISAGLLGVLRSFPYEEAQHVSMHCAGLAFDVHPVAAHGAAIKQAMDRLPGRTRFLQKEDGLEIWHVQF